MSASARYCTGTLTVSGLRIVSEVQKSLRQQMIVFIFTKNEWKKDGLVAVLVQYEAN
jgi:hypothetical protein